MNFIKESMKWSFLCEKSIESSAMYGHIGK